MISYDIYVISYDICHAVTAFSFNQILPSSPVTFSNFLHGFCIIILTLIFDYL